MMNEILKSYEESLIDPLYSYDYLYLHIDYIEKMPVVRIGKQENESIQYVLLNGFDKNETCFALLVRLAAGAYEEEHGFIHKIEDLKISKSDKELVELRKVIKKNEIFDLTERQKADLIKASKDRPRYIRLSIPRDNITISENIRHFKSRLRKEYESFQSMEKEYQEEYSNADRKWQSDLALERRDLAHLNALNVKKAIDRNERLVAESYNILKGLT